MSFLEITRSKGLGSSPCGVEWMVDELYRKQSWGF